MTFLNIAGQWVNADTIQLINTKGPNACKLYCSTGTDYVIAISVEELLRQINAPYIAVSLLSQGNPAPTPPPGPPVIPQQTR